MYDFLGLPIGIAVAPGIKHGKPCESLKTCLKINADECASLSSPFLKEPRLVIPGKPSVIIFLPSSIPFLTISIFSSGILLLKTL